MKLGAGILFCCLDDKTCLLVRRSKICNEAGTWSLPGGNLEPGEDFITGARREAREELSSLPSSISPISSLINGGTSKDGPWKYRIYIVNVSKNEKELWVPKIKLDKENDKFTWFPMGKLPKNLHSAINIII
jgi:ADP-ribose pyrophosphatase YjhB (NUDIX family)